MKLSPFEMSWREFRATLDIDTPAEIEFSDPRTRTQRPRHTRRRHPYPELDGITGKEYHRRYMQLKRTEERGTPCS